ncbi:hemolymph lipopolysaccharide-binding protein-like, partial [Cephus cinctus]|uniref:Hemolymph lipopolysaccharide-binding protein-like n=1 Tax=Cephus cinctus TaxID=211228 RepID=A0AAJ7FDC4_CEPCN
CNVARKICEEEGGYLAIVNSIAEADVLKSIFEKVNPAAITNSPESVRYAAIGFHDLYQENEFITIHGDNLYKAGFTKWLPGQPDDTIGKENCGSLHISGRLNDINCHTRFPFFCELR